MWWITLRVTHTTLAEQPLEIEAKYQIPNTKYQITYVIYFDILSHIVIHKSLNPNKSNACWTAKTDVCDNRFTTDQGVTIYLAFIVPAYE